MGDTQETPQDTPMESKKRNGKILTENKVTKKDILTNRVFNMMIENLNSKQNKEKEINKRVDVYNKNLMINEEMNSIINKLDDLINDEVN